MDTHKSILTVVKIVVPFAEIKIEDADGIDFLYFGIEIAQFDMFRDGFRHTEEYTFQVIDFPCVLYFYDDDFVLAVFGLDVHTVELFVFPLLVTLAFQYLDNMDWFV